MKNQTDQRLSNYFNNPNNNPNNPKTPAFTPPTPPISFLPISGPGGRGIGVTSPESGTIAGITCPGNSFLSFYTSNKQHKSKF